MRSCREVCKACSYTLSGFLKELSSDLKRRKTAKNLEVPRVGLAVGMLVCCLDIEKFVCLAGGGVADM